MKNERSPFLLIFRNTGAENYRHLSPDQRQDIVERWNAWFECLLVQGKAVEGQPLEDATRIVAGLGGLFLATAYLKDLFAERHREIPRYNHLRYSATTWERWGKHRS